MFVYLKLPGGDKHVTLFAQNLQGDENYDRRHQDWNPNSDRSAFNYAVVQGEKRLTTPDHRFPLIFNQFDWKDTSGWEIWSDPDAKVLKLGLLVAASLEVPLHVHTSVLAVLTTAGAFAGITFAVEVAKPVEKPLFRDFHWTNQELGRGEYFVLKDVKLPPDFPQPIKRLWF